MAATHQLIAAVTVGSGGASYIDFTSIPSTFTDLIIKVSGRNSVAGNAMSISLNNGAYSGTYKGLQGDGGSAASYGNSTFSFVGNLNDSTSTANTFASIDIYIPNAFGTAQKSISVDNVTEHNGTTAYTTLAGQLYNLTSAITSIRLAAPNSFVQNSTAYLYGVKNA